MGFASLRPFALICAGALSYLGPKSTLSHNRAFPGALVAAMDGSKTKTESSLTTAQAVKLRARQLTAVAGDKFKVASASLSRGDTQVST